MSLKGLKIDINQVRKTTRIVQRMTLKRII